MSGIHETTLRIFSGHALIRTGLKTPDRSSSPPGRHSARRCAICRMPAPGSVCRYEKIFRFRPFSCIPVSDMILLIDNYDSFTHNLFHLLTGQGEEVTVLRNDALTADAAMDTCFRAVFISPGPGRPEKAGICLDVIGKAMRRKKPVFGVCLGMQAVVQACGGTIGKASRLMHGKTCAITHDGTGLFASLPLPFTATRYHSLAACRNGFPGCLNITATAAGDNEIMAVEHDTLPVAGVQFHPESFASEGGGQIVRNFLERTGSWTD